MTEDRTLFQMYKQATSTVDSGEYTLTEFKLLIKEAKAVYGYIKLTQDDGRSIKLSKAAVIAELPTAKEAKTGKFDNIKYIGSIDPDRKTGEFDLFIG